MSKIAPLSAPPPNGTFPTVAGAHNYEIFDGSGGMRCTVSSTGTAQYEIWHAGSDGIWGRLDRPVQLFGGGEVDFEIPADELVLGECFTLVGVPGMLATDSCYLTSTGTAVSLVGLQY